MKYTTLIDSCIRLAEFEGRARHQIIELDKETYEGFGKENGFPDEAIKSGITIWHKEYIIQPIKTETSESSKALTIIIS